MEELVKMVDIIKNDGMMVLSDCVVIMKNGELCVTNYNEAGYDISSARIISGNELNKFCQEYSVEIKEKYEDLIQHENEEELKKAM